jgi:Lsr2
MAQRVIVQLDCDIDNESGADVETVTFGFQGTNYELELCAKHRKNFDAMLNELVGSARRISAARRSPAKARQPRASQREENAEIRAWAMASGLKVSERGRIAADVIEQFNARGSNNGSKNGKTVIVPAFKDGSTSL